MKRRAKKIILSLSLFLFPALLLSLGACRWNTSSRGSVILIAVDQLGVNQVNCTSDNPILERSGIGLLCQESIRFTHAYTTSVLSGPALTSLLTAQYPFQHGLRSNSRSFLSARVTTLAEVFQKNGFATSFFSGGPPILGKLNLQQGFETFDDLYLPTNRQLFRPFLKSQNAFKSWLRDLKPTQFFSVFYVPDLSFKYTVTQTDLGENRNLSFESQVEEFDESLFTFIQSLKAQKVWDSTTVILVGLQGPDSGDRPNELPNSNLFSERTQVALLIKTQQKPRDEGIHWTFDGNVNLADLGLTLLENFKLTPQDPFFSSISLNEILKSPSKEKQPVERPLLVETAWSEIPAVRYAVRWEQFLFLLDEQPKVFNSFIDKFETTSLRLSDASARDKWAKIEAMMLENQWKLWPKPPLEFALKWDWLAEGSFERLAHRLKNDEFLNRIYTRELLNQQNWEQLSRWAVGTKSRDLEMIALKNLKRETKGKWKDPCLSVTQFPSPQLADLKSCTDTVALSLLEWFIADKQDSRDSTAKDNARKKFLRQYSFWRLDQKIMETHLQLQAVWELSADLKNRTLTVDMLLALPEMSKYRLAAHQAFQQALSAD